MPARFIDTFTTNGCEGSEPKYAYGMTARMGIESEKAYSYESGTTNKSLECRYNAKDVVF